VKAASGGCQVMYALRRITMKPRGLGGKGKFGLRRKLVGSFGRSENPSGAEILFKVFPQAALSNPSPFRCDVRRIVRASSPMI